MKVLILSQYYPPENALIAADVASWLVTHGHQVTVLTGYPNYPKGRLFTGYRMRWRHHEMKDGVEICRVPLFIDHSLSTFRRILNYTTFALSSATARRFTREADVIYVYAPQMTPALGPWLWRMTGGPPYVLHVVDLWPESIVGSSLVRGDKSKSLIESFLTPWLRRVYSLSAAVIGPTPAIVRLLEKRGAGKRTQLLYNWARAGEAPVARREKGIRKTTRVLYAGNIGDLQDLEIVIRAAAASADAGISLTLIGDGVEKKKLELLVESLKAENVTFQKEISPAEIAETYKEFHFGIVSLKDLPVFHATIPSKFQALLAHGVPVLTTVRGEVQKLTQQEQVGFFADPKSAAEIEKMFRLAAACPEKQRIEIAQRAWKLARNKFNHETALKEIEGILQDVADEGRKSYG